MSDQQVELGYLILGTPANLPLKMHCAGRMGISASWIGINSDTPARAATKGATLNSGVQWNAIVTAAGIPEQRLDMAPP